MYRLLQLLELIHNPPPKNATKRPDSPKSQVWRILIYHSSKSKTTQEQSESVGLLTSPTCRPGAVNLHNLHIEIIRITILIIIWPFKLLNSLQTQPPECPHMARCPEHGIWSSLVWEYLVQVTMMNDTKIFAMKITRSLQVILSWRVIYWIIWYLVMCGAEGRG